MDKYGKLFVKASMVYLGLGTFAAIHIAFADHGYSELRFLHVHFMLIGFMSMTIFGVGYHILPRFNAKPLPYPSLVPVHFWLANVGLLGMGSLYTIGAYSSGGAPRALFGLFGTLEAAGMFIFIISIWSVLTPEKAAAKPFTPSSGAPEEAQTAPVQEEKVQVKLAPKMKIAEILEKYPHLEEAMAEEGLGEVVNPAARQTAAKLVTLEMAAKKADKELYPLMARLEGKQFIGAKDKPEDPAKDQLATAHGTVIKRGEMATMDTLVGPLMEAYPETKSVLEKNYGEACFTCPGQNTETVEQTASIHGSSPQKILDEINAIITKVLS